jgi:hypothetical protein
MKSYLATIESKIIIDTNKSTINLILDLREDFCDFELLEFKMIKQRCDTLGYTYKIKFLHKEEIKL